MTKTLLCIDFGGGKLRIFDKNLGLVYNEPALIAVEKKGKKYVVLETGQKALEYKNSGRVLCPRKVHSGRRKFSFMANFKKIVSSFSHSLFSPEVNSRMCSEALSQS